MESNVKTASSETIWLTTGDVARHYGVCYSTVARWIDEGIDTPSGRLTLRARRHGRWFRVQESWLREFDRALNADPLPIAEPERLTKARARKDQLAAERAIKRKTGRPQIRPCAAKDA
jgi:hypothetical protein